MAGKSSPEAMDRMINNSTKFYSGAAECCPVSKKRLYRSW